MPDVSVILPCFNNQETILAAVRSVLWQSKRELELIVLDDGSLDNSMSILRCITDRRLRIVDDGAHLGIAARLNMGVNLSTGKYVARMDADDVCFPRRLEQQVALLESEPAIDVVGCRAIVFRNDGSVIGLLPFAGRHEDLCRRPWRNIPLPHPTWCARREWFERHPYTTPEYARAEDQELLLRAMDDSRFACLPDVLLGYRQGKFRLRRTLVARMSLFRAHASYFTRRREWTNLIRAVAMDATKSTLDILVRALGVDALYFRRMGGTVSTNTRQEFAAIWESLKDDLESHYRKADEGTPR